MDTLDTLAKRLVWARTRKDLTQEELAKKAGVSQGTIGNLEAGIRDTARKITSIARALDVDANWLADNKGAPPNQLAVVPVKRRDARMVLAYDDEEELFDLYRRTDDRGRREIIKGAKVEVARVVAQGGDKGESN